MTSFNPQRGLIIVRTHLFGPSGDTLARLALDTGASATMIWNALLVTIGYDPDSLPKTVKFTTDTLFSERRASQWLTQTSPSRR